MRAHLRRGPSPAVVILALAAAAGVAAPACADGLRRLDAAWLIPVPLARQALGAASAGASGCVWLRAGHTRLFGLPELPVRLLAGGVASGAGTWACEAGWESAGAQLLRDDRWRMRLAVGRRLRLGLDARWRRLRPGPGPDGRSGELAADLGLTGTLPAVGTWDVAVRWPLTDGGDRWLPPESAPLARLAAASAGRALALAFDAEPGRPPTLGWEALCALTPGLGLSWRSDRASGAMGLGLMWSARRLRVRTSHLAHPVLGLTHRLELTVGDIGGAPW